MVNVVYVADGVKVGMRNPSKVSIWLVRSDRQGLQVSAVVVQNIVLMLAVLSSCRIYYAKTPRPQVRRLRHATPITSAASWHDLRWEC